MNEFRFTYEAIKYYLFWRDKLILRLPEFIAKRLPERIIVLQYVNCRKVE